MTDRSIYLDHHATTPVDPRVAQVVSHHMLDAFGNPSSSDHMYGDQAAEAIDTAQQHVAELLGSTRQEVFFTSGATESLNWALRGTARALMDTAPTAKVQIGVTSVEHPAVLDTVADLERHGVAAVHRFPVDQDGNLDIDEVANSLTDLDVLCVMAANHEVGTIYPIGQIASLAHNQGVLFICDASQAVGKIDIDFHDMEIDMLAFSTHKLYGPKGVGALLVRAGLKVPPLLTGGGQQRGRRSGTLNVPGIAGTGEACRLRSMEMGEDEERIAVLRDRLEIELALDHDDVAVNGDRTNRLSGNLNISFPVPAHAIIARIRNKIACSTGSACSSGLEQPSHVLRAMGIPKWRQQGAIRVGLGRTTTKDEILTAASLVSEAVADVKKVLGS